MIGLLTQIHFYCTIYVHLARQETSQKTWNPSLTSQLLLVPLSHSPPALLQYRGFCIICVSVQIWCRTASNWLKKMSNDAKRIHEKDGWEYKLWWEWTVRHLQVRYIKESIWPSPIADQTVAILTDRLRLLVLRDHGGVFTDIDVEFVRSFEHMVATELPHSTTFFAGLRREPDEVTMLEVTPLCILPAVWHPLLLLGYRLQFPVSSTLFLLSHSHDAI